jgi:hypothetical protein
MVAGFWIGIFGSFAIPAFTATRGAYRGKPEYSVVSAKGTVEGHDVSLSPVRTASPRVEKPGKPLEAGMMEWNTQPGEWERFRAKVAGYNHAVLLELFDRLPHPYAAKSATSKSFEE